MNYSGNELGAQVGFCGILLVQHFNPVLHHCWCLKGDSLNYLLEHNFNITFKY